MGRSKAAQLGNELSNRERQVFTHLSKGLRPQEIAAEMGVCLGTIDYHVQNAYRKLGASHRVQALRLFNEQHDAARKGNDDE